jgi:hypothetical protein
MNISKFFVLAVMLAAAIILGNSMISDLVSAHAPTATLVVHPGNLQGWQIQTSGVNQTVTFENGPPTPPLPPGSVELAIIGANGNGAAQLRQPAYGGTLLSQITAFSYSTHVTQWTNGQAPYLILNIDHNNDGVQDDLLFFEPEYQNGYTMNVPTQADLTLNTWQTWNALTGGWYSINGFAGMNPAAGVRDLATYLAVFPNSRILNSGTGLGGLRIVAGFGAPAWDNFIGNVDNFTIGVNGANTTYDFNLTAASAATVSVGGRVWGANGYPVPGARISYADSSGNIHTALSNPFGYYSFEDVEVGTTYVFNVSAKGYSFNPQVVEVNENMNDLNFTAQP